MSDSSSDSENSQNDSEYNFISDYVIQDERQEPADPESSDENVETYVYADEPLADDEWLLQYNRELREKKNKQEKLERRLTGTEPVESWCTCGNCDTQHLQNASECYCCREIERCVTSLTDELVLEDVAELPCCITLHPGFRPVCLEKWPLRISAEKYRCRDRRRYKKRGSEAGFLRSVAYREFTYIIHGYLGDKRIALPACAYNAIREKFKDDKEGFSGFEDFEED